MKVSGTETGEKGESWGESKCQIQEGERRKLARRKARGTGIHKEPSVGVVNCSLGNPLMLTKSSELHATVPHLER